MIQLDIYNHLVLIIVTHSCFLQRVLILVSALEFSIRVVHRPCQCWAWDIGWLIKSSYPYIRMSEMWGCYEMYLVAESLRIWNLGSHTIYNTFESDSELTIFWLVDHNFFLPWLQLGDTVRRFFGQNFKGDLVLASIILQRTSAVSIQRHKRDNSQQQKQKQIQLQGPQKRIPVPRTKDYPFSHSKVRCGKVFPAGLAEKESTDNGMYK